VLPLLDEYEVISKSLGLSVDQLLNKEAIPGGALPYLQILLKERVSSIQKYSSRLLGHNIYTKLNECKFI
jgi:hypothetical protein